MTAHHLLRHHTHLSLVDKHLAKKGLGVLNGNEDKHFLIQAFQTQLLLSHAQGPWKEGQEVRPHIELFPSWETMPTGDFLGGFLLTGNTSLTFLQG